MKYYISYNVLQGDQVQQLYTSNNYKINCTFYLHIVTRIYNVVISVPAFSLSSQHPDFSVTMSLRSSGSTHNDLHRQVTVIRRNVLWDILRVFQISRGLTGWLMCPGINKKSRWSVYKMAMQVSYCLKLLHYRHDWSSLWQLICLRQRAEQTMPQQL